MSEDHQLRFCELMDALAGIRLGQEVNAIQKSEKSHPARAPERLERVRRDRGCGDVLAGVARGGARFCKLPWASFCAGVFES